MNPYAPRYYAPRAPSPYGHVPYGYGYAPGLGEYGFPPLAALLPIAAKAIGAIAPVAAKAASAIIPMAGKAASAIIPMAGKATSGLLPQLLTSLPGLIPMPGGGGGLPGLPLPAAPFISLPAPMPGQSPVILTPPGAMAPAMVQRRRRRRSRGRSLVRVLRDRATGVVKAVRPLVAVPPPGAAPFGPSLEPALATSSSGGMAGFHGYGFGYPYAGLHACGHCGGLHGPGQRCCGY